MNYCYRIRINETYFNYTNIFNLVSSMLKKDEILYAPVFEMT